MKDILAGKHLATLAEFACSSVLLGFDYDGTLAPIASIPARARMRAATHELLSRVAHRYPCVVISGRAHHDLAKRLHRLPLWEVIGNHGVEPWTHGREAAVSAREWVRRLRARLEAVSGIVIEDKKYSVTVHYRHVRDKVRVRRAIATVVRDLPHARALGGEQAVNLILRGGPDKGVALQWARRALSCETAIYVGDDDTDEDAFASAPPSQLLAIRVGPSHASRARYRLKTQADIRQLSSSVAHAAGPRVCAGQPQASRRLSREAAPLLRSRNLSDALREYIRTSVNAV